MRLLKVSIAFVFLAATGCGTPIDVASQSHAGLVFPDPGTINFCGVDACYSPEARSVSDPNLFPPSVSRIVIVDYYSRFKGRFTGQYDIFGVNYDNPKSPCIQFSTWGNDADVDMLLLKPQIMARPPYCPVSTCVGAVAAPTPKKPPPPFGDPCDVPRILGDAEAEYQAILSAWNTFCQTHFCD